MSDILRPDFRLHTLGWRAFQDLALTVVRQILGQTVQSFADGNDGGRDGAFFGTVDPVALIGGGQGVGPAMEGPFVFQCKACRGESESLAPSDIRLELEKVADLVRDGLCESYILATNATVTANSEAKIRKDLISVGVKHVLVLEKSWFNEQIAQRADLRRLVPRLYGLGDLSQILDQRRYDQTLQLLKYSAASLRSFVPTSAYTEGLDLLINRRSVLLLGDPAAGKSTIATALAAQAADKYEYAIARIDSADEFIAAWNPHEPNQAFWVDDAFGRHEYDEARTEGWARRFDMMRTALSCGARFIFTSRDYIYKRAAKRLRGAPEELRKQIVYVHPGRLMLGERQRILYNQLRFGNQDRQFISAIKPHLDGIAKSEHFTPELARRLGVQAFTVHMNPVNERSCAAFLERPVSFLLDVLATLDNDSICALALIYLERDGLISPMQLREEQLAVLDKLGGTVAGARKALESLDGSLVRKTGGLTSPRWNFQHPTLAEAFAVHIGQDFELLDFFVAGLTVDSVLRVLDCSDVETADDGRIHVPPSRYESVSDIFPGRDFDSDRHSINDYVAFYAERCSKSFLRILTQRHRDFSDKAINAALTELVWPGTSDSASSGLRLIARLKALGLLRSEFLESIRRRIVAISIDDCDPRWMSSKEVATILNHADLEEIRIGVRKDGADNLAGMLEAAIDPGLMEFEDDAAWEDYLGDLANIATLYAAYWPGDSTWASKMKAFVKDVDSYRYGSALCGAVPDDGYDSDSDDAAIFSDIDDLDGQGRP
ncbi:hypothetical protein [Nonomuraea sp. NPDC050310]|uniref:nSTAND3 domain-containing NTPase n=1 Tax=Nonomuraea sp. NPDC050310 TaxID=3154935 RepID=UPI0033D5A33D